MVSQRTIKRRSYSSVDELAGMHPLLQRIYAARGVSDSQELDRGLQGLPSYRLLRDIDKACGLLQHAIEEDEQILIVADFDADGATSCATLLKALRVFGAKRVDYIVPNRFEYGYGLTPEIIEAAKGVNPQLLITVDNGISSHEGVAAAKAKGMNVLVTDHHLPGDSLPEADAIVNPNRKDDSFPCKHLAGVGVVFYLIMALRASLRQQNWFETRGIAEPNIASLLDLVALGTVADVVPLSHCNRILVAQGLARIRQGRCSEGLKALVKISGRDISQLVATDLGFSIAPRLNAAGRLEDMSLGIEALLSDNEDDAVSKAQQLDALNRERREIEAQMRKQAMDQLKSLALLATRRAAVGIALYEEDWHQGVVGIVASRVKERFNRPVVAFARLDNDTLKGSARSIPGLHIRDVFELIAAKYPGLILKFGGHAMAAGLNIPLNEFERFSRIFDEEAGHLLSEEALLDVVLSDGELAADELNLQVAELLRQAGPWGQGFPEPLFDGVFTLLGWRTVGEKHLKMTVSCGDGHRIDAIAFNTTDESWPSKIRQVHLAYKLDINDFRGRRQPQLLVEHIVPLGA